MNRIRWEIAIVLWWLFLKVAPRCQFKSDMMASVASLRRKYS